jgi:hypothetical protein
MKNYKGDPRGTISIHFSCQEKPEKVPSKQTLEVPWHLACAVHGAVAERRQTYDAFI